MGVSDGEGILGFGIDWAGSLDGWEDVLHMYGGYYWSLACAIYESMSYDMRWAYCCWGYRRIQVHAYAYRSDGSVMYLMEDQKAI
jgi:hypothetical protein